MNDDTKINNILAPSDVVFNFFTNSNREFLKIEESYAYKDFTIVCIPGDIESWPYNFPVSFDYWNDLIKRCEENGIYINHKSEDLNGKVSSASV